MDAITTSRPLLTVAEFRDWNPGEERWELVDGEPREMSPPTEIHALLQAFACPLSAVCATSHFAAS